MSNANERQEGGRHYQAEDGAQHWDLVVLHQWDYFQAQIIKYLMRWKKKHASHRGRVEDLKKARHFLDKYIENAERYDENISIEEWCEILETSEGIPMKDMDFDDKIDIAVGFLARKSEEEGDAGPGYVDQDRDERLPGCLDDTRCPEGTVRLRPGGPCVPDTGRQR